MEHGGIINMSVSSIGLGAGLIPLGELPGREARHAGQMAAAQLLTASLHGDSKKADFDVWDISYMTADIVSVDNTVDRRMQFVVDHQSSEIIVKVIDNATEEVVRVLPPEELQRLLQRNPQGDIGFLFSERA
jgi:flagellar protein FlaG